MDWSRAPASTAVRTTLEKRAIRLCDARFQELIAQVDSDPAPGCIIDAVDSGGPAFILDTMPRRLQNEIYGTPLPI
jgi:hypothetical protein